MFRFRLQAHQMTRFHSRGNPLKLLSENWMERLTVKDVTFEAEDVVGICKNFNLPYENRELLLPNPNIADAMNLWTAHIEAEDQSVNDTSLVVRIPRSPKHTYDYMLLPATLVQLVKAKS